MAFTLVPVSSDAITRAVELLRAGGLVAFPTETVYGLGADAENQEAVASIYSTKGRPSHNPLILHVSSMQMAERYGVFNKESIALAEKYWPGPVTLVVPRRDKILFFNSMSDEVDTVAIRIPDAREALELIDKLGSAIVAPSANRSGRISPTQASHVQEEFTGASGNLKLILDGGHTRQGIESTVIRCIDGQPIILRHGSIIPDKYQFNRSISSETTLEDAVLHSPGMLGSHYAPDLPLRLNAKNTNGNEALLAFGPLVARIATPIFNLSEDQNLDEAAHNLYTGLRVLDKSGCDGIAVMPIPEKGVGIAINDRLRRAAAPRK